MSGDIPTGGRIEDWVGAIASVDPWTRAHLRRCGLGRRFGEADVEAVRSCVVEKICTRAEQIAAGESCFESFAIVRYFIKNCVRAQLAKVSARGEVAATERHAAPRGPDPETTLLARDKASDARACLTCVQRNLHAMLELERSQPRVSRVREAALMLLLVQVQRAEDGSEAPPRRPPLPPDVQAKLRQAVCKIRKSVIHGHCGDPCQHWLRSSR